MKYLINVMVLFSLALVTPVFAQTEADGGDENQSLFEQDAPTVERAFIRPCSYWRYEFDVSGYVCTSLGSDRDVVDVYDFQQLESQVRDLERRVADLEQIIRDLQNRP